MDKEQVKYLLDENEMPKKWYNINADLPRPLDPPLHPVTMQPLGPQDLAPLFAMELIKQEVSTQRYIDIPTEVRDIYRLWRPTPLYRARRLEAKLKTPRGSTTSMRASRQPAATSRTRRSRRHTITRRKA